MSLIYWENVLVGDPGVPFDITFKILTQGEHGRDGQSDAGAASLTVPLISAHKLILGLTSPVFRSQLYGGWKEGGEQIIEVVDVTYAAFRTMVNYMYGMPLRYSVEFLTVEKAKELFEVVYAAEKYLIPQLSGEIVALINKAAITTNTVQVEELVRLAEQFSHLDNASRALFVKCEEERENAKKVGETTKISVLTVQSLLENGDVLAAVADELNMPIGLPIPVIGEIEILEVGISNDDEDLEPLQVYNNESDDTEPLANIMLVGNNVVAVEENVSEDDNSMEIVNMGQLVQNEEYLDQMNNGQFDDSLVDHTDQINLG